MAMPAFRVEFYKARDGKRWRVRARNNKIVCESGEAYSSSTACEHAFNRVEQALQLRLVERVWVISARESKRIFGSRRRRR